MTWRLPPATAMIFRNHLDRHFRFTAQDYEAQLIAFAQVRNSDIRLADRLNIVAINLHDLIKHLEAGARHFALRQGTNHQQLAVAFANEQTHRCQIQGNVVSLVLEEVIGTLRQGQFLLEAPAITQQIQGDGRSHIVFPDDLLYRLHLDRFTLNCGHDIPRNQIRRFRRRIRDDACHQQTLIHAPIADANEGDGGAFRLRFVLR